MQNFITKANRNSFGVSTATWGSSIQLCKMKSGRTYTVYQETWNTRTNYYVDLFVYHLEDIIKEVKENGNPVKEVLELGMGRGVISIGIALLTEQNTRILGIDIQESTKRLVHKNASINGVDHKIEVRIGNLFSSVNKDEKFDMIVFDLPHIPVNSLKYKSEIALRIPEFININGGADGRRLVDSALTEAFSFLNQGGVVIFTQPCFIGINRTLKLLERSGFNSSILIQKEWPLAKTKFTKENRKYIETINDYSFAKNTEGESIFFLNIIKGVKRIGS